MRVWIVNPFDNLPPEGYRPQRYWLMSRAFAEAGHETVFWTSGFSHSRKAPRDLRGGSAAVAPGFSLRLVPAPPYVRNVS
ncbi:MAG: glycosyltransferase WbuB, partial [Kiritimatiellae bacterium]|nr:glycosyltransferase WbuB [Kiritimatiellia bacterium]